MNQKRNHLLTRRLFTAI